MTDGRTDGSSALIPPSSVICAHPCPTVAHSFFRDTFRSCDSCLTWLVAESEPLPLQIPVEPGERVGLHRAVELVAAGIKAAAIPVGGAGSLECLAHDSVGPLHFVECIERVFIAVEHHRGRRGAQAKDL